MTINRNMDGEDSNIILSIQGTIKECKTTKCDNVYCHYKLACKGNWNAISGQENGITQTSVLAKLSKAVFNHHFALSLKSKSPFGWPQMIFAVYGTNLFGNDTLVGYGACHIPVKEGFSITNVRLFAPKTESVLQQISQFFTGLTPELSDFSLVTESEGRDDIECVSAGSLEVHFNVGISKPKLLEI